MVFTELVVFQRRKCFVQASSKVHRSLGHRRPTRRAPDAGESARFTGIFHASAFSKSDGGTPSDEKKVEAGKRPVKRADSPASGARIVGRRSRDERDTHYHDSMKHLRRMGLQHRLEGSMRRKCGRAKKYALRHEAHAAFGAGCA